MLFKNKIAYVMADLRRVGPTNQTLNIIKYSGAIQNCIVVTLFEEKDDTQIQEYIDNDIEIVCLNLNRYSALLSGVGALRKILKENNVKLVHSYGTFADLISHYACKTLLIKHVVTLRNFPMEDATTRMNYFIGFIVAQIVLFTLKRCKNIVACSNTIRDKMNQTYSWANVYSIQNGVDFYKFTKIERSIARKELGISENKIIFISTGSLIKRKRIDETINAFLSLRDNSNKQLWILGDGLLLEKFKKTYSKYNKINFFGKQANVIKYLSAADVFVSSSESEGMPNAVLEAVACGLPVYLSDIPQHREILDNVLGVGELYELGNVNALGMLFQNTAIDNISVMKRNTVKLRDSSLTMENMGKKYGEYYKKI